MEKQIVIKQKSYGNIEVDQREKDCVILVSGKGENCNLIQIDRRSINDLVNALQNGNAPK